MTNLLKSRFLNYVKPWPLALSLAGLLLLPFASSGADSGQAPAASDGRYQKAACDCERGIRKLNPAVARRCYGNERLIQWLHGKDPQRASELVVNTGALVEMQDAIRLHAAEGSSRSLLNFLAPRLESAPYSTLGLGPNPNKVAFWVMRNSVGDAPQFSYQDQCAVTGATLPWDLLLMKVKKAAAQELAGSGGKADLDAASKTWEKLTLSRRLNILKKCARREFAALMKSNCEHTGLQEAEAEEWTEFASDSDMGRYVDYAGRCDLLDQARSSLVKAGADKKGSPPGRRLYALARYLERTGQGNSSLARQVAELRTPARLSKAEQAALQPLLTESFMRQLRTTEVGREVAAYFDSGKKLDLRLGNMAGAWAYYDPSTDAITLSAAALSSYMRVNGYTLKDMLSDQRARDAYAAFFAPTLLHEAIHQMQHSWAAANGLPDVYLKSLEEETFAKQSLYVLQRMKNDPEYEKMLRISKRYSFYVQDLLSGTDQLRASPQNLMMSVDALYDSVPALPGGRAETIAELNRELKRRARMPQAEQQTLEEKGLPYEPAMQKYAYDRKGPLPYMKTSVLEALRSALVTKKDLLEANAQGVMEYVLAKLKELSGEETAPKEETDEYCVVY